MCDTAHNVNLLCSQAATDGRRIVQAAMQKHGVTTVNEIKQKRDSEGCRLVYRVQLGIRPGRVWQKTLNAHGPMDQQL